MSDLILLGKRVWFGLCALVFLGLLVQWLNLGANEVDETLPPAAPIFADAIDIVAARQQIAANNLWEPARKPVAVEDTAQQEDVVAVEKTLYLAALLQRGSERSAWLGVVGEPDTVKRYTEGELLPNGGQLLKIHADNIEYKLLANVVDDAEQTEAQHEQDKNQTDIKILYLFGRSGNINE